MLSTNKVCVHRWKALCNVRRYLHFRILDPNNGKSSLSTAPAHTKSAFTAYPFWVYHLKLWNFLWEFVNMDPVHTVGTVQPPGAQEINPAVWMHQEDSEIDGDKTFFISILEIPLFGGRTSDFKRMQRRVLLSTILANRNSPWCGSLGRCKERPPEGEFRLPETRLLVRFLMQLNFREVPNTAQFLK